MKFNEQLNQILDQKITMTIGNALYLNLLLLIAMASIAEMQEILYPQHHYYWEGVVYLIVAILCIVLWWKRIYELFILKRNDKNE